MCCSGEEVRRGYLEWDPRESLEADYSHQAVRKCELEVLPLSQQARRIPDDIEASVTKMQLLLFFHNNPFTLDDLEGVSIWVGMHKEEIAGEVEQLCQMGLLVKHGRTTNPYYSLTDDPELVELVRRLVERFTRRSEKL